MPGKARVHELAKELGLESKALLAWLKENGEVVKSASSTIEPPVARKVREAFGGTLHAGGGVASDADLDLYERLGLDGAIVGRALYEGKVSYPRTA